MKANVKFGFSLAELSGALADLGVLLPLTLALITLNGFNPSSVVVVIGLAYLLNAFAYRLPIPVHWLLVLRLARAYRILGAPGTVGFISPLGEHFCTTCNRLRLTADGRLRPCLLLSDEVPVRESCARVKTSPRSSSRRLNSSPPVMCQIGG